MARNQGRKAQQKSIFFLIFGPILLAAMHQALTIYLSSLSLSGQLFSFFLRVMQKGEAQKPNSFFRASPPPHPRWFMVDLDPVKRSKATPSSNK
jgi:hypothetical protein